MQQKSQVLREREYEQKARKRGTFFNLRTS